MLIAWQSDPYPYKSWSTPSIPIDSIFLEDIRTWGASNLYSIYCYECDGNSSVYHFELSIQNLIIDGYSSKIVGYYSMALRSQMVRSVLMDAALVKFLQNILIDISLLYSFVSQGHGIAPRSGLHLFELSKLKLDSSVLRTMIESLFLELTLMISTNITATNSIFCISKFTYFSGEHLR